MDNSIASQLKAAVAAARGPLTMNDAMKPIGVHPAVEAFCLRTGHPVPQPGPSTDDFIAEYKTRHNLK